MKAILAAVAFAIVVGWIGYGVGVSRYQHRVDPSQPGSIRFVYDTLPPATAEALALRDHRCQITERSPGELEAAKGIGNTDRSRSYGETYMNCWVVWIGKVVDTINWPDATELVVEDSLGGRARLNVGPINLAERQYLGRRWFIAYFGQLAGEADGVPLVRAVRLWPAPSLD